MHLAARFLMSGLLLVPVTAAPQAGVTAVVLNWARLHNVVGIVQNLCSPVIDDVMRSVVVWNNNPRVHLTRHHFTRAACPSHKLTIVNSPVNVYFQARFLACSDSTTEFCFLQDDDYLVRLDVIRSLYTYLSSSPNLTTIHLLPPHEHLTTALRTTLSPDNTVHTGFAWLGHGALLRRSAASTFLELLRSLHLSEWEMKMADNYYTILSNIFPTTWMDDGIPLDGTGAFTVGTEGDERNWDHITRALQFLDRVLLTQRPQSNSFTRRDISLQLPTSSSTAVCIGSRCTISTNINSLPSFPPTISPFNMKEHEYARRRLLGSDTIQWLLDHPLSHAVDMSNSSFFASLLSAKQGDYLVLDALVPMKSHSRVIFNVDIATHGILGSAIYDLSQDKARWVPMKGSLECQHTCTLTVLDTDWRSLRIRILHDMQEHWKIFDIRIESTAEDTITLA